MYQMDWDIRFTHNSKIFKLNLLAEVTIDKSVEALADTAIITLPASVLNKVLDINSKIGRGANVTISLGYNGELKTEFIGFVQDIQTNDSSLIIKCEDALFLFRVGVKNKQMKPTSLGKICQYLIDEINAEYSLSCDYDLGYESFVINQATGFDVLKKVIEETKANIYFDTINKVLHVHPPFKERGGIVKYSMDRNIESSSLEYKKAIDRKAEVTVESVDSKGKVKSVKAGTTGGESVTIKVGAMSESDMRKVANAELLKRSADAYKGSIDTWLIPSVEPTYTAEIKDPDYPEKDGRYYVKKVTTNFSSSGAKRTVEIGIKLSV